VISRGGNPKHHYLHNLKNRLEKWLEKVKSDPKISLSVSPRFTEGGGQQQVESNFEPDKKPGLLMNPHDVEK
jgi:hypothetical protein